MQDFRHPSRGHLRHLQALDIVVQPLGPWDALLAKNADYEVDERLERLGLDYIDLLLLHHTAAYDEQAYQTLSQHEVIKDIAQAHQKSTYQVILRWHLQSGIIAIPGSSCSISKTKP